MAQAVDMSQHFGKRALLRFVAPSIAMMVFTSIYGIVDGFFISNFAGSTAFAAVNLILPFVMILGTVGFMVGTGGGALVGQARGEGDDERANRWFSLIVLFAFVCGIVLAILGCVFMRQAALVLGADKDMIDTCVLYGRISMISLPAFILQFCFQPLFSTAGKPKLGLFVTLLSGCANIVLDFVLVGVLGMDVTGAALATVTSELLGGLVPLAYFALPNSSALRLCRPRLEWHVLGKTCVNGSSEMMGNVALNVVSMLYNWQLMRYFGEDGVFAYGIIMYVWMVFGAILIGYSMGSAPLMSYQYGARNKREMRSLFGNGMLFMCVGGVVMCIFAQLAAPLVGLIFAGYDQDLYQLTVHSFRIYTLAFVVTGYSIFGSSLFTSLGNGLVSALIEFARALLFEVGAIIVLPLLFGAEAIWYSVLVAEGASLVLTSVCILWLGPVYGLFESPRSKGAAGA